MAYLRGQERFVLQGMLEFLRERLDALGWMTPDVGTGLYAYGAVTPVTIIDHVLAENADIPQNTIAMTQGEIPDEDEAELGSGLGGLWRAEHYVFIDIWGENQGIAKSIQADVLAILRGRLPLTSRSILLKDYSLAVPVAAAGHSIEFEEVHGTTPERQPYKKDWRSVKVLAVHWYNARDYHLDTD